MTSFRSFRFSGERLFLITRYIGTIFLHEMAIGTLRSGMGPVKRRKTGKQNRKKQLYRNNFNQTYRTFISIYSKQDCQVFFNDVITANALGIFNILLYVNIVFLI